MHKDVEKVLMSEEDIVASCKRLGKEITEYYSARGEVPILVALLKGSVPFLAELIKHIDLDIQYEFMDVSSYEGTKSVGDIKVLKDLDMSITGLPILLVEDIVDTGRTLVQTIKLLENKGAKSVDIVAMLDKPSRRTEEVSADFLGFTIPDEFVIGFGLDYNQKYRNLPYVGVLKKSVYE